MVTSAKDLSSRVKLNSSASVLYNASEHCLTMLSYDSPIMELGVFFYHFKVKERLVVRNYDIHALARLSHCFQNRAV